MRDIFSLLFINNVASILLHTLDCTDNVPQLYCTRSDILSLRMCLDCTQHTLFEGWLTLHFPEWAE